MCAKCGGLVVTEYGARRCVNCGYDPDLVLRQPDGSDLDEPETQQEDVTMSKWTPEARAAHQQRMKDVWAKKRTGGGTAPVPHGDNAEAVKQCGVTGCKKDALPDSTQCRRHRDKSLRNNIRYREKTKKALNGSGTDWKAQALSALVSQRETLTAKIQEIDTVLAAIQGL